MTLRRLLVVCTLPVLICFGAGPSFIPDDTFKGSSLTGWHSVGQADWKANNGEIAGTPKSETGGLLLMDRSLQDSGFYASFRCTGGCKTGILTRVQKTSDGMKGLLVSLTEGDQALYRVTLNAQGQETHREKLRGAAAMIRLAQPPPAPNTPPGRAGGGRGA